MNPTFKKNQNSKRTIITKIVLLLLALLFSFYYSFAQDYTQTVKGRIIDKESHSPISFATVLLKNTIYEKGTIANEEGFFMFDDVPVGRVSLQISFVGYKAITISNLEVTSGKELQADIEMVENVVELNEVKVKAFNNKEKPLNSFAPISARTFSVEESQRYAGSGNDVSRMAMNFAGVSQAAETTNEIIIRGNSPVGLLFRLDGIDIPNPSHFGDGGTTGGSISMMNNNVLSNSDFFTSAFPAEYGNTISGVFDLKMKTGNTDKHEFMAQTGMTGIEAGAEGPISKSKNSSYLINYRYSNLDILQAAGVDIFGSSSINYQDIFFKFNFPSRKIGHISIFGFGGNSNIKMFDSERDTTQERLQMAYESDFEVDILQKNKGMR